MELKLDVQTRTNIIGNRIRQRRALTRGLVMAGVVGLILLAILQFSSSTAKPAVLREQLGMAVAPVNQAQIDTLVHEQAALRQQLGMAVAPVNQAQIDTLVREQAALREQLGMAVAPVDPAQIARLVQEQTTLAKQ
jgi:hypothetical protein